MMVGRRILLERACLFSLVVGEGMVVVVGDGFSVLIPAMIDLLPFFLRIITSFPFIFIFSYMDGMTDAWFSLYLLI
jgi:hypothetical protein